MKNCIAAFMLYAHVLLLIKPFNPFIEYTLNQKYIAEVLCINKDKPQLDCQGTCYLNKQLQKENTPEQNSVPMAQQRIKLDKMPPAVTVSFVPNQLHARNIWCRSEAASFNFSQYFSEIPTPPPKAIV